MRCAAILASFSIRPALGGVLMSAGALISIAGVYEVFSPGSARLSYAMAADSLLPPLFAHLDRHLGTPVFGLAFQAASALILSLVLNVQSLISVAVVLLGIAYAATALSD
jgi:basic amino acid/polyamine antiporter, APA family